MSKQRKPTIEERGCTWKPDSDPDASWLEQEGFEDRLAEYRSGAFGFTGCYAWADVIVSGTVQRIRSPGLWGIEDDSEAAYMRDVEREEAAELDSILRAMGVTP